MGWQTLSADRLPEHQPARHQPGEHGQRRRGGKAVLLRPGRPRLLPERTDQRLHRYPELGGRACHDVDPPREAHHADEAKLPEMFAAAVRPLKLPEDVREAFIASLKDSRRDVEVNARARITAAQARLERVSRLINAAYEDKLEGRIDDGFFNAKRAEWEGQRAEAAEELQRPTRASAKSLDQAIQVFELANRAYELMISREPREQRRLLDVLLSNSVLAEGRLTVTWSKPFDVLAEAGSAKNEEGGDSDDRNRRHSVWSGHPDSNRIELVPKDDALQV